MAQPLKRLPLRVAEPSHTDLDLIDGLPATYTSWLIRAEKFSSTGHLNSALYQQFVTHCYYKYYYDRHAWFERAKRIFDLGFGLLALLFVSPLLIFAALGVKFSSPGPIFFRHLRAGKNGQVFMIYKFRTMQEGSSARDFWLNLAPLQKAAQDVRVTRFGAWLRKWKVDELPQLINVIRGEMSIVGPRPLPLEESATCPQQHWKRFAVRPGLTGLWQAMFPNTIDGKYKFQLDALYVEKRSIWLDCFLILCTVPRVLKGEPYRPHKRGGR